RAIKQWRSQFRGEPIVKDDIDVTQEDVESSNLAVWGDVYSNKLLAAMGGPSERFYLAGLRYTNNENDGVVGKQPNQFHLGPSKAYRADNHVPVLIFPNPINPDKYLVLNSGFTFREYDYLNNARQSPKLPDWAVIDVTVPPNTRSPGGV